MSSSRLVIQHQSGSKANRIEEFPLDTATTDLRIGRDPANAIVFDAQRDNLVSRHHAVIRLVQHNPPAFRIADLGSSNGTFVNGSRIDAETELSPGDKVQLGSAGPAFVLDVQPRPRRAAPTQIVSGAGASVTRIAELDTTFSPLAGTAVAPPPPAQPRHPESAPVSFATGQERLLHSEIPVVKKGTKIRMSDIRDTQENAYLAVLWAVNAIFGIIAIAILLTSFELALIITAVGLWLWLVSWISWKLLFYFILGNSVEVGRDQYPQIYRVVKEACELLEVPFPTVLIMQGHGMFELFVAKRYSRRGFIIVTSNMMDEFAKRPTSKEFMMFVGMQLGHIKAGHFNNWFFTEVIGKFGFLFYSAWKRRCRITADRVGLLVAGELYPAEQALFMLMAGSRIAAGTSYDAIAEQRTRLFESGWAWLRLAFSTYPYMIDRIVRLREFADSIGARGPGVGALPIEHRSLSALPLLIIHGHDRMALLELKDFIHTHLPQVVPRLMVESMTGSMTLPDKFEKIAHDVVGAIALLTPDDIGGAVRDSEMSPRARQNVVVEIGWVWSKLGRGRLLLLSRGHVDLPSDLAGTEVFSFQSSPQECSEPVRGFVDQLIRASSDV